MSRGSEGAVVRAAPTSWVIAVVAAFCAVLLLKWLALVAVAAVALFAFVRWARGGGDDVRDTGTEPTGGQRVTPARSHRLPYTIEDADVPAPRSPTHDDCTWCGLRGGHRDGRGHLVRPRHAHAA